MIVTYFETKKHSCKDFLETYLFNEKLYGPLYIELTPIYISKPLTIKEIQRLESLFAVKHIEINKKLIKDFSRNKKVLWVYSNSEEFKKNPILKTTFKKASYTDFFRYLFDWPLEFSFAKEIIDALAIQREIHKRLRDNKDISELEEKLASNNIKYEIDFKKKHCKIFIGKKQIKAVRKASINELKEAQQLVYDIEVEDFNKNPLIFLISTNQNISFGLYDIDREDYIKAEDPVEVFSKFRADNDFLFYSGHNNLGFDEQKLIDVNRSLKARIKTKKYFPSIDNQQPKRRSDQKGSEILIVKGCLPIDSYLIASNYLSHINKHNDLESLIKFLSIIERDFNFEKSIKSYTLLEEKVKKWKEGNLEEGNLIIDYCQGDVKASEFIANYFKDFLLNVMESLNLDFITVATSSARSLAFKYWQKKAFRKTNRLIKFIDKHKIKSITEFKKIFWKGLDGIYKDVYIYYFPSLFKIAESFLPKNLIELARRSKKIESIMYYRLLETLSLALLEISQSYEDYILKHTLNVEKNKLKENIDKLKNDINSIDAILTYDLAITNKPLNIEDILYVGKGNAIKIGNFTLLKLEDYILSYGKKIYLNKKDKDPADLRRKSKIEIVIESEFIEDLFVDKNKALKNLNENIEKIRKNLFPAEYFIINLLATRNYEDYDQASWQINILKKFKARENELVSFIQTIEGPKRIESPRDIDRININEINKEFYINKILNDLKEIIKFVK